MKAKIFILFTLICSLPALAAFDEISYEEMVQDLSRMKQQGTLQNTSKGYDSPELRLALNTNLFKYISPTGQTGQNFLIGPSLHASFKTQNSPFIYEVGGRWLNPVRIDDYLHTVQDFQFGFGGELPVNTWRARFLTSLQVRHYSWDKISSKTEYWKVHPSIGLNFQKPIGNQFFVSLASQMDLGAFGSDTEVNQFSGIMALGANL